MLILGLLGMYFDAAVVFVTKSSLFFRLAVAILWALCFLGIFAIDYFTLTLKTPQPNWYYNDLTKSINVGMISLTKLIFVGN